MGSLGGNGEKLDRLGSLYALLEGSVSMQSLKLLLHTAALEIWYFTMPKVLCHIPSILPDRFSLLPGLQEFAHSLPPSGLPSLTCHHSRAQVILEALVTCQPHIAFLAAPDKGTFPPLTLSSTSRARPQSVWLNIQEPFT